MRFSLAGLETAFEADCKKEAPLRVAVPKTIVLLLPTTMIEADDRSSLILLNIEHEFLGGYPRTFDTLELDSIWLELRELRTHDVGAIGTEAKNRLPSDSRIGLCQRPPLAKSCGFGERLVDSLLVRFSFHSVTDLEHRNPLFH